jgi:hypothetical protein
MPSIRKGLPKGRRYTDRQRDDAIRLVRLARQDGRGKGLFGGSAIDTTGTLCW